MDLTGLLLVLNGASSSGKTTIARALLDAAACFAPLGGFLIGIKPPLGVSERWEAARGNRSVGHARTHYDLIHAPGIHDLVLDPSQMTPEGCAQAILNQVRSSTPSAFQQILDHRYLRFAMHHLCRGHGG